MKEDREGRVKMARLDDAQSRGRVLAARRLIYEKNFAINSTAVEDLLKGTSQIPTIVSYFLIPSVKTQSNQ